MRLDLKEIGIEPNSILDIGALAVHTISSWAKSVWPDAGIFMIQISQYPVILNLLYRFSDERNGIFSCFR